MTNNNRRSIKCDHCGALYSEEEYKRLELTGHNRVWNFDYERNNTIKSQHTRQNRRRLMGKVGFKIAIVEFRGKIYAGYKYEDGINKTDVWHFQEINGLGHFRATKDRGFWDNYEYDHEAVFGVEIEDKNRELYKMLHKRGF